MTIQRKGNLGKLLKEPTHLEAINLALLIIALAYIKGSFITRGSKIVIDVEVRDSYN